MDLKLSSLSVNIITLFAIGEGEIRCKMDVI